MCSVGEKAARKLYEWDKRKVSVTFLQAPSPRPTLLSLLACKRAVVLLELSSKSGPTGEKRGVMRDRIGQSPWHSHLLHSPEGEGKGKKEREERGRKYGRGNDRPRRVESRDGLRGMAPGLGSEGQIKWGGGSLPELTPPGPRVPWIHSSPATGRGLAQHLPPSISLPRSLQGREQRPAEGLGGEAVQKAQALGQVRW